MASTLWLKDSTIKIGGGKVCIAEACPCGPAMIADCLVTGCSTAPEYWQVDLASGGWTDGACGYCDQVNGTYILGPHSGTGTCRWGYQELAVCTVSSSSHNLNMQMTNAGGTKYTLNLSIDNTFFGSFATYEYDPTDSPSVPCPGPFTFTKVSESHTGTPARCAGTMPATITCQAI